MRPDSMRKIKCLRFSTSTSEAGARMKVRTRRTQLLLKGAWLHRGNLLGIFILLVVAGNATLILAQGMPTATRTGDLQVGGGFTYARSGYNFTPLHLIGGTVYATFD